MLPVPVRRLRRSPFPSYAILFRPIRIALSLAALWAANLGLALGPEAALAYQDPALPAAREALAEAIEDLWRARLGLSAGLEAEPILEYTGETDDPEHVPELAFDFEVGVELSYRYDRPDILGAALEVVQAEEHLRDLARAGREDALLAQADLLLARHELRVARGWLVEAERALAAAETGVALGETSEVELARARLEVAEERLEVERAERHTVRARDEAVRYGFSGEAEFAAPRFVLPDPELEESAFNILEDLRLTALYETDSYELDGALVLEDGRPGVDLGASYRLSNQNDWEIGLSATLHLDEQTFDDAADAGREVVEARRALDAFEEAFARDLAEAKDAAVFAEQRLELALQRLTLTEQRIAALEARIEELQVELDRAETDTETAENALAEAQSALAAARRDLGGTRSSNGDEENLYRAWIDYIGQVGDYLELVDGDWELK